jgi:hypothetical protein
MLIVGFARESRLSAVWRITAMFGRVAGPEARETLVKDHTQHPVTSVIDSKWDDSHGAHEG